MPYEGVGVAGCDDNKEDIGEAGSLSSEDIDGQPLGEDEFDSLDAFMNDLDGQLAEQELKCNKAETDKSERLDDAEDMLESYAHFRAKQLLEQKGRIFEISSNYEYDSEDNLVSSKRMIEQLAPLDYSQISYEPFERNFYTEAPPIAAMSDADVSSILEDHRIKVFGTRVPKPVSSFSNLGLHSTLLSKLSELGFTVPTSIQMQALPVALSGRDMVGVAQTGSGKTIAYTLPLLTHVMMRRKSEGVVALVVAPTRELVMQIHRQLKQFSRSCQVSMAPVVGLVTRNELKRALRKHDYDVLVGTPGVLIDMIRSKAVRVSHVSFMVLDEADRMFDLGFEPQVRSILGQVRPDRQLLLFSATLKPCVEQLNEDVLADPVKVVVGAAGAANEDINQIAQVLASEDDKWEWLSRRLPGFVLDGSVIVFVGSKSSVEKITARVRTELSLPAVALHGDKTYDERERSMAAFKRGDADIMIATDIAARGLDIKSVRTVVNYANTGDIDAHIHRIGRTGRAGDKLGIAYTLLTPNETHFAKLLLKNFQLSQQDVPQELLQLAKKNTRTRKAAARSSRTEPIRTRQAIEFVRESSAPAKKLQTLQKVNIKDASHQMSQVDNECASYYMPLPRVGNECISHQMSQVNNDASCEMPQVNNEYSSHQMSQIDNEDAPYDPLL